MGYRKTTAAEQVYYIIKYKVTEALSSLRLRLKLQFTKHSDCRHCCLCCEYYEINKCNHTELKEALGITDFTEPYQNIRAGLYILRRLFEKYDEPAMVCMAYNMGEYGASVLWDNGVYETSYSQKVLAKAEEYAAQRE